jgi:hypothetical protein
MEPSSSCHTAGLARASPSCRNVTCRCLSVSYDMVIDRPEPVLTYLRVLEHGLEKTAQKDVACCPHLVDRPQGGQDRGAHTCPWPVWTRRMRHAKAGVRTVFAVPASVCTAILSSARKGRSGVSSRTERLGRQQARQGLASSARCAAWNQDRNNRRTKRIYSHGGRQVSPT